MAGKATSVIGRGAHVRGKVAGEGDLEILGRVDGDVAVDGEVTIEAGGLVGSNVNARRIVVRGAVKGNLTADEAILLDEGARVVGDIRAQRVAIASGGLVRGYVQSGDLSAAPRAATSASKAVAVARPAIKAAPVAVAPPRAMESTPSRSSNGTPARSGPPPLPSAPVSRERVDAPSARAVSLAGGAAPAAKAERAERQGPPAPVVPALKKGAKGTLKKKA